MMTRMRNTATTRAFIANSMTEVAFQQQVTDLCDLLGLRWHHETDSRRSKRGFPDLVIVGQRLIFAELKSQKGRLSKEQRAWITDLMAAGVEAYVWRPSDLPTIIEVLHGLAGRRVQSLNSAATISV